MGKALCMSQRVVSAKCLLKEIYSRGWKCELLRMTCDFFFFFKSRSQVIGKRSHRCTLAFLLKSSGVFIDRSSFLGVKWVDNHIR